MTANVKKIGEFSRAQLVAERDRLTRTVSQIDISLQADNFYQGDKPEVEKSRRYFQARLDSIKYVLTTKYPQQERSI